MKNVLFSALAMIALAGCAGSEIEEVIDNGQPVAIQLNAGVQATTVVSRAAITGSEVFKPIILGWESTEVVNYASAPTWKTSTTNDIAGNASNTPMVLAEAQYYDADVAVTTYMKAFYAEDATVNATDAWIYDFANTDGQKDMLITVPISGTRTTITPAAFAFTHPLMQLIFKVKVGKGFPDGRKLTSITVKNAELPIGINLGTDAIIYSAKADLSVTGAADVAIAASASLAGSVMIKPIAAGSSAFQLDVVAGGKTYSGINVTLDTTLDHATSVGVAYTVTLTFEEKISAEASVTDWVSGTGSGTVE